MQTRWLIKTEKEIYVKLWNGKREIFFKKKQYLMSNLKIRINNISLLLLFV